MEHSPEVSIVIPAYNEEKLLPRALESITEAMVRTRFATELIIVDNASTDATPKIAEQFGATVLCEERKGVGHARQTGLEASRGKIILTSDADGTQVQPGWIEAHQRHYDNPEIVAVSGAYKFYDDIHPIMKLYNAGSLVWHRTLREFVHKLRGLNLHQYNKKFAGSNMSYLRDAAIAVGGYRSGINVGEDTDLAHRLEDFGPVIRDESTENTILTSGRRYQKTEDVLPVLGRRIEGFYKRYVHGEAKVTLTEGTMKDVR